MISGKKNGKATCQSKLGTYITFKDNYCSDNYTLLCPDIITSYIFTVHLCELSDHIWKEKSSSMVEIGNQIENPI